MTGVDWLIVVAIVLAVTLAAKNGFFREAFGIAGLIVGYLLAAWQYPHVAVWFSPYVKSEWLAELVGFAVVFGAVLLVAAVAGKLAQWVMKEVGLSWFDRVMGGALGLVKGGLGVAVLLVATTSFAPSSKWLSESELAPYFLVVGRAAIWVAPSELRARFYQGLNLLHHPQATANAVSGNR